MICKWISCEFAQVCTNVDCEKVADFVDVEECEICQYREDDKYEKSK